MTELDTTTPPDDQAPAATVSTDTEPTAPIVPPEEAPDVEPVPDLEPAPEPAPLGAEPPATEEAAPEATPESPEVVAVPEPESADEPPPDDAATDAEAASDSEPAPDTEDATAPNRHRNPTSNRRWPKVPGRSAATSPTSCAPPASDTPSPCPGESFLGLLDAFEGAGIRVIATRHEGAAAFMAEAHGQLTGRPAVALGTRAVGGANLAIGIHTARQDSTPMFVAVGQVERALLGREAFQEIDQVATLGGLAKWAAEPHAADEIADTMAEAVRQALGGRPGPVLLSLPEDLLDEPIPDDTRSDTARPPALRATDDEIRAVIEFLASAERPVILAGGGVLRARTSTELLRFAELLQVPIIAAWRRADVISNDHPLYLGMAGYGAAPTVQARLDAADALVVIGSRLNEATTFGYAMPRDGLPWAHVDLVPGEASGSTAPTISVATDAKAFLKAANERLLGKAVLDAALVATRQANNRDDRAAFEAASVVDATRGTGRASIPAGRSRRSAGCCPTTRS